MEGTRTFPPIVAANVKAAAKAAESSVIPSALAPKACTFEKPGESHDVTPGTIVKRT